MSILTQPGRHRLWSLGGTEISEPLPEGGCGKEVVLTNAAVREHLLVERRPPETLPATAHGIVSAWMRKSMLAPTKLALRQPSAIFGMLTLRPFGQPEPSACHAELRLALRRPVEGEQKPATP